MSFGKLLDELESALTEARHASGQVEKIVSEIRTRLRALSVALGPISDAVAWATSAAAEGAPAAPSPFNGEGMLRVPEHALQPFECPHRDGFIAASQKGLTRHLHASHFENVPAQNTDNPDERCTICGRILRHYGIRKHMETTHGIRLDHSGRRLLKARKSKARLDTPRTSEIRHESKSDPRLANVELDR